MATLRLTDPNTLLLQGDFQRLPAADIQIVPTGQTQPVRLGDVLASGGAGYILPDATGIIKGGVIIGGGLVGNGPTISVAFGTVAGVAAQGNDSRIVGALQPGALPAGAGGLLGATATPGQATVVTIGAGLSYSSGVLSASGSAVPSANLLGGNGTTFTSIAVGNGLGLVGGNLAVTFGTLANTAAAGNDSRFGTIPSPGTVLPSQNSGSGATGTGVNYSREDHVHPIDTSRAPLASPNFSGVPSGPTAAAGTNTTQFATTAFVAAAVSASTTGVASFNGRTGTVVLTSADVGAGLSVTTGVASVAFGTSGTTAAAGNDSRFATIPAASSTTPAADGTAAIGTGTTYARADHVHPTDATRAPLASPNFSGTPTVPTATAGTNTTQAASTAFVAAAVAAGGGGGTTAPRIITSGATATLVAADAVVVVRKTTGSVTTITLEASPTAGSRHKIKDGKGDAGTNNITIVPAAGTIDGAASFTMSANYSSYEFIYDGTEWGIY